MSLNVNQSYFVGISKIPESMDAFYLDIVEYCKPDCGT